ncbi:DUF7512 family protein [Halorubrum sp. DTA46]|uniref:DUF7512 family protein n=1 Tax=Halorubrum sp. DTA46 TaxID=3402162 RepID=UPI003AADE8D1
MTGTELLPGASPSMAALAVISVVLVEAAVLYVGYGFLEEKLGPTVFRRLERI